MVGDRQPIYVEKTREDSWLRISDVDTTGYQFEHCGIFIPTMSLDLVFGIQVPLGALPGPSERLTDWVFMK